MPLRVFSFEVILIFTLSIMDRGILFIVDFFGIKLPESCSKCVWSHDYLCVFMCARRLLLSANLLPHCAHPKGFSPVWDRMCPCSSQGRENPLPQTSHLCERLCVRMCMARAGLLTYILLQMWQHLAFSAVMALWVCLCLDRLDFELKSLLQISQWNLFSL